MDLIYRSKRINGLCYRGKTYELEPLDVVGIKCIANINAAINAVSDWGASQTKGYKVTFTVNSSTKFELRSIKDISTKLNYIPEHSFVLFWGDNTVLDTLTLVYDGDYMFHIEGTIGFEGYHSVKTDVAGLAVYGVYLVDGDGNFFLTSTTTNPITTTKASSQTTINYSNPTLTFERLDIPYSEVKKELTLPYKMYEIVPENEFTETIPTFKVVGSTAPAVTTTYSQKFL